MDLETDEQTGGPATYSWTATARSADLAARSLPSGGVERTRNTVALSALCIFIAVYFWNRVGSLSFGPRLFLTAFLTLFVAAGLGLVILVSRIRTRRELNRGIRPGDELTSVYGVDRLALATPRSRRECSYDDIDSIHIIGAWAHVKEPGSLLPTIWPAVLFPPHELEKLVGRTEIRFARR